MNNKHLLNPDLTQAASTPDTYRQVQVRRVSLEGPFRIAHKSCLATPELRTALCNLCPINGFATSACNNERFLLEGQPAYISAVQAPYIVAEYQHHNGRKPEPNLTRDLATLAPCTLPITTQEALLNGKPKKQQTAADPLPPNCCVQLSLSGLEKFPIWVNKAPARNGGRRTSRDI